MKQYWFYTGIGCVLRSVRVRSGGDWDRSWKGSCAGNLASSIILCINLKDLFYLLIEDDEVSGIVNVVIGTVSELVLVIMATINQAANDHKICFIKINFLLESWEMEDVSSLLDVVIKRVVKVIVGAEIRLFSFININD